MIYQENNAYLFLLPLALFLLADFLLSPLALIGKTSLFLSDDSSLSLKGLLPLPTKNVNTMVASDSIETYRSRLFALALAFFDVPSPNPGKEASVSTGLSGPANGWKPLYERKAVVYQPTSIIDSM